jgi:hypothetical protein
MSRSIRAEWRSAKNMKIPGNGRIETFLNFLGSTTRSGWDEDGHRKMERCHPVLHWPACRLLDVMGWWHYRIQRNACKDGSRLCWQPEHWPGGKLGPIAEELNRQMQ